MIVVHSPDNRSASTHTAAMNYHHTQYIHNQTEKSSITQGVFKPAVPCPTFVHYELQLLGHLISNGSWSRSAIQIHQFFYMKCEEPITFPKRAQYSSNETKAKKVPWKCLHTSGPHMTYLHVNHLCCCYPCGTSNTCSYLLL